MGYEEREPIEATVAELKPRMKNVTISFKVISIGEEREIESRRDGSSHRVCDVTVGDPSGTVQVPLWDETIDSVEEDATYNLTNGYTGLFRGNLRLNVGRYGKLEQAEEAIEEIEAAEAAVAATEAAVEETVVVVAAAATVVAATETDVADIRFSTLKRSKTAIAV
ncbi:MAG: hypothetical protein ACXAAP_08105 [Candidatus Thorarchaeota archaeon]|jgi:replication factor A1